MNYIFKRNSFNIKDNFIIKVELFQVILMIILNQKKER